MTRTRWLTADETAVWRAFRQTQLSLFRLLEHQMITTSQLSSADYEVLVPLSEAVGHRLRARDLGRVMGWERSRVSHQLRRMEHRKLVSRAGCPTDARGTFIELTSLGLEAVDRATPAHIAAVRENFIDVMTAQEIATMTAVCGRVLARIEAGGGCADGEDGDDAGPCPGPAPIEAD